MDCGLWIVDFECGFGRERWAIVQTQQFGNGRRKDSQPLGLPKPIY
jgi:hypothetical protein